MPTEKPRATITVSPEQLQQINNYRFKNKMKNQTQAILSLIESGLAELEEEIKSSPSTTEAAPGDVFRSIEQQYGSDAHRAFSMYVQLDQADRGEIRGEMKQMLKADKYKNAPSAKGKTSKAV